MPKTAQTTADTATLPLVHDVLKRVAAAVKKVIAEREHGDFEPGGYPVDLSIDVVGDITIASDSKPAPDIERCVYSRDQLLAALIDDATGGDPANLSRVAGRVLTRAKKHAETGVDVGVKIKAFDADVLPIARKRDLTKVVSVAVRKGACGGSPTVTISGTIGEHRVEVEGA